MGWSSIRTFQVEGIVHEGRFRNRKGQHNEKKNLDVNMVFVGTIRAGIVGPSYEKALKVRLNNIVIHRRFFRLALKGKAMHKNSKSANVVLWMDRKEKVFSQVGCGKNW